MDIRVGGSMENSEEKKNSNHDDLDEMFARIKKLQDNLDDKIAEAYHALGLSQEELKRILSRPELLTEDQRQEMVRDRKAILKQAGDLLTPEEKAELIKIEKPKAKKSGLRKLSYQRWMQM